MEVTAARGQFARIATYLAHASSRCRSPVRRRHPAPALISGAAKVLAPGRRRPYHGRRESAAAAGASRRGGQRVRLDAKERTLKARKDGKCSGFCRDGERTM